MSSRRPRPGRLLMLLAAAGMGTCCALSNAAWQVPSTPAPAPGRGDLVVRTEHPIALVAAPASGGRLLLIRAVRVDTSYCM